MILSYLLIVLYIQGSLSAAVNGYKSYKDYKVYEIEGDQYEMDEFMRNLLRNYRLPYQTLRRNKCHIVVAPSLVPVVNNMTNAGGLSSKVLVKDYSAIIKKEKAASHSREFTWNAYHNLKSIYAYLHNMSRSHPEKAEVVVGGHTYEGREILGLRINTPTNYTKPAMFLEAGIHAREWLATASMTYFINELLTSSDPKIQNLTNSIDWYIFPTVNPDGYHYSFTRDRLWRKTRSRSSFWCYGADPNRNWDYNWRKFSASSDPCDYQLYAGAQPFSEIETRTLAQYIKSIKNLMGYVAYHAYAKMMFIPFSDSKQPVDNYDDLMQIGEASLKYGFETHHEKYAGPASAAELLYKTSGSSMDWVRHTLHVPLAYTYELRGVSFHYPPHRIAEQGDKVTRMMLGMLTEAKHLGYY